jgi:MinD-like ATPase involved in chromosome partitioning or flagellar assembly
VAEIASFYSYKGGAGRSTILAGVAILLAQKGRRIVCIDFDLQSGGLHTIFGLVSKDIQHTVLDILTTLSPLDVGQAMLDLSEGLSFRNKGGRLWLLATVTEAEKLREVLDSGRDLTMLFSHLISEIIDTFNPHFILVDSQSGFAQLASAPILNADRLICVLRPNRQNVEGIRNLLDILNTLSIQPEPFLVLSQVPATSEATVTINKLRGEIGSGRDFNVILPFIPELSLEENDIIRSIKQPHLANYYQPVVDWLEGTMT